jgi:ribonuclease T
MDTASPPASTRIAERFRGYLPVVVDVETGGFSAERDALLEVAAVVVGMDEAGFVHPEPVVAAHVVPFPGANLDPRSLEITGIDPTHPFRAAMAERDALNHVFKAVRKAVRDSGCQRAILVGHNAAFDLGFLNAAVRRTGHKRNPFHPFSCFDTATLGGLAYGQTVLSKAVLAAGLDFDSREAHSAIYDAERTALLFCGLVNRWKQLEELEREHLGMHAGPTVPDPVRP